MENQDVKIAGSGTISEGIYNNVVIAGSASANGEITCELLKIAGSGKFLGNVNAKEVSVAGSTKFEADLKGEKIKIAGSVKVMGNISSEELNVDGVITVEGECNVGTLKHKGEGSKYNNIYGENINLDGKRNKVVVNEIEATNITLHKVFAKRVSGDVVKLTGKCEIEVIEYKNKLILTKNVQVKEIIKL